MPPPGWVNSLELTRDQVVLQGEAEQAAALLKTIDGSPLFQNSEFTMPLARTGNGEAFRIRAAREGRSMRMPKHKGALAVTDRDKRALAILATAGLVTLLVYLWPQSNGTVSPVSGPGAAQVAEKRLARARELAAAVPGREEVLKRAAAELAEREKGLIQADTAPQAQAQLLQILRRVARNQAPPVEIRNTDITGPVKPYGRITAKRPSPRSSSAASTSW